MSTLRTTPNLHGFDVSELNENPNTCYIIDTAFQLLYANPAYYRFAEANDGLDVATRYGIGVNVLDAISGPQREFFANLFAQALQSDERTEFDYECSSAREYRMFRLILYPLPDRRGLVARHAVIKTRGHESEAHKFREGDYADDHKLIHQCGHCRRVRHLQENRWDWCPEALGYHPISHTLCDACVEFYYRDVG